MTSFELEECACLLCGSADSRRLFTTGDVNMLRPGAFGVARCRQCGLCYTSPRPRPEDMPLWYPAEYFVASLEEGCAEELNTGLRALLELMELPRPGAQVLDVGCGVGNLLRVLQREGWEVSGVDPSEYACRVARRALGEDRIAHGTLESLGQPDASLDAVVMADVLEHLHEPIVTLGHVCRVLKPGGRAYFKVPNYAAWQARVCGKWWYGLDVPRHLVHFTPRTLRAMLQVAGFQDILVQPVAGPIGATFFEISLVHRLRAWQMARRGEEPALPEGQTAQQALEGHVYETVPGWGKRAFRWALRHVAYMPLMAENWVGRPVMMVASARR